MQLLIVSWRHGVPVDGKRGHPSLHMPACSTVTPVADVLAALWEHCVWLLIAFPRVVSGPVDADVYARLSGTKDVRMFGASSSACSNGIPTGFGAVVLGVHAL